MPCKSSFGQNIADLGKRYEKKLNIPKVTSYKSRGEDVQSLIYSYSTTIYLKLNYINFAYEYSRLSIPKTARFGAPSRHSSLHWSISYVTGAGRGGEGLCIRAHKCLNL